MDLEKAIAEQNFTLGRIEAKVDGVASLQALANGRTTKLEDRVSELEELNDKRLRDLESAKDIVDGRLQAMRWMWAILIVIVGIIEFIIGHFWK